jgi:hypothetical protein
MLALALGAATSLADNVTNIYPRPGAMQPGGDASDTTRYFGVWWTGNGQVAEDFDMSMHSSNNIAGSLHIVIDCPGGTITPVASANLAFGNFLSSPGDNGWLGAGISFDASKYESLSFDININTLVSSNSDIPIALYGSGYENKALATIPIANAGWQHIVLPISTTIGLPNCTAYGVYDWYNTTASTPPAHVEYWLDNVMMKARIVLPPPPTLSLAPVTQRGLLIDSAPGEGGQRGAIDTVQDVHWVGTATPGAPVTYAMTISSVPNPAIYSNYEAHIFLAPNPGVGNPDWNLADMGYLQILTQNDGTAIARMMWKTNDAFDNKMLFNEQPGGQYGTNGYAAGTLGYLNAPTMVGTWSITFTGDAAFTVSGPGGVSANFTLPSDWVTSFGSVGNGLAYAYFGGGPNGNNNSGQAMYLSKVAIGSPNGYALTNDFTDAALDTTVWALLGNETVRVLPSSTWWVKWTLPATDFNLWAKGSLDKGTPWVLLNGNTNLPVPISTYTWGTNVKALVASESLPSTSQTFFAMRQLVATKLQVLMPGETNAPFTATGKVGTPQAQQSGSSAPVIVNAVDGDWNIVTSCVDTIHISSSDTLAALPADAALVSGSGTFVVAFITTGTQTVTAADLTKPSVTAGTSSPTTVTP